MCQLERKSITVNLVEVVFEFLLIVLCFHNSGLPHAPSLLAWEESESEHVTRNEAFVSHQNSRPLTNCGAVSVLRFNFIFPFLPLLRLRLLLLFSFHFIELHRFLNRRIERATIFRSKTFAIINIL